MRKEKHKVKVLILTEFFPESEKGEITGGVEARCFYVSKYLKDFGHQIIIISRPASRWTMANWQSLPERFVFTARALINGLSCDFDLVEGTNFTNHLVAAFLGFLKSKPVVCWYPDVFVGQWFRNIGWVGIFGEIAERLLFKIRGVNYIAISQTIKDKLIENGVPEEKIFVVYCGVAPVSFRQPEKYYDVCAVSRLLEYKHLDNLITAAKGLRVVIVGQGPEEKRLRRLSSKNVSFLGFIEKHEDVLKIMASSKIFCHPSTVEGFGIVIIEAMSQGVPVVVADIPVVSEITEGGKGALLFKPQDTTDLAKKIQLLLSDKTLYNQKVKEALTLAKKYAWEKAAKETEKIYENLHVD